MLANVVTKILTGLLTETFIKKIIVLTLKSIAKKTDNKVDDELVQIVEEALYDVQESA